VVAEARTASGAASVSLPCDESFPATKVSLRRKFPCDESFPATKVSLRRKFLRCGLVAQLVRAHA
jgi:hypothetical protein